jgi:uncharacterized protein DUF4149
MAWLRFLSLAALAIWIGGLGALGTTAAPTLFSVLESREPAGGRELAGVLFGEILLSFQHLAWICGVVLIVLLTVRAMLGPRPARLALRVLTVVGMLAMSVGTTRVIMPRIDRVRAETRGPIAALQDADPRRREFNRLHGLANGLMTLTLLAGLGLLWFEARDQH